MSERTPLLLVHLFAAKNVVSIVCRTIIPSATVRVLASVDRVRVARTCEFLGPVSAIASQIAIMKWLKSSILFIQSCGRVPSRGRARVGEHGSWPG